MSATTSYFSRRISAEDDYSTSIDQITHMSCDHFLALVGMPLDYYGCDASNHTFKVDNIIFKILEDPDDGYRSCLGAIDYTEEDKKSSTFYRSPISKVNITSYHVLGGPDEEVIENGYKIIESGTEHCWLVFGTLYHDNYYPSFHFRYFPKTNN